MRTDSIVSGGTVEVVISSIQERPLTVESTGDGSSILTRGTVDKPNDTRVPVTAAQAWVTIEETICGSFHE